MGKQKKKGQKILFGTKYHFGGGADIGEDKQKKKDQLIVGACAAWRRRRSARSNATMGKKKKGTYSPFFEKERLPPQL